MATAGSLLVRDPSIARRNAVLAGDAEAVELEQAFAQLSTLSETLSTSYRALEARVENLSGELADVSARRMRELAEKEQLADWLESLLRLLPGGVVVLDGRGQVRECNPAAEDLLGQPLLGQTWVGVIRRAFAPRNDDGHEVSLRDGRRVSIATASLGNAPGQVILLIDQTETRRLQAQLSQHERLSGMGKMVASLAHQVRTPLSAALLYTGHLCDETLTEAQRVRFAEKVKDRLLRLESQVRDMLMFARGDTPAAEQLAASELMEGLRQATETEVQRAGAEVIWLNAASDTLISCNREALLGAFSNLIENALQACGTGAQLSVFVREEAGSLRITVADNGPGIPAEQLSRVSEPFFTSKPYGTGLGLAVVQSVARSHGGKLELESDGVSGTQASIELPVKQH